MYIHIYIYKNPLILNMTRTVWLPSHSTPAPGDSHGISSHPGRLAENFPPPEASKNQLSLDQDIRTNGY